MLLCVGQSLDLIVWELLSQVGCQVRMYYSYPGFNSLNWVGWKIRGYASSSWLGSWNGSVVYNDVRSLVSVLDILGQEVNLMMWGEVLLYLYSDGSLRRLLSNGINIDIKKEHMPLFFLRLNKFKFPIMKKLLLSLFVF